MTKELIKEIIRMFLQNEKEDYRAISELPLKKEAKDKAKEMIESISFLEKHLDSYDLTFEIICENLNKKDKKTSKNK